MKKGIQIFAVLAVLVVTAFTVNYAQAQSTGLGINPRKDYTVAAGKSVSDTLYLSNLNQNVPIKVSLTIVDFESADETGTPSLLIAEDAEQPAWSLRPFLNIPETVELGPGESKYVPFSISIPENQGAGSYYSAIKYDPQGINDAGNLTVSGAPTQLVFATVPGNATQLLNLKNFGAYSLSPGQSVGAYKSLFVGETPSRLAFTLENRGNVAESPSGSIIIKDIFGRQVHIIRDANPKRSAALIGQTRRFDVCIDSATERARNEDGSVTDASVCRDVSFWPGIYTAELSLFYGLNGSSTQEISAKTVFWYMPWWFIGVLVLVIAAIAGLIIYIRKRLTGTKRHVRKR